MRPGRRVAVFAALGLAACASTPPRPPTLPASGPVPAPTTAAPVPAPAIAQIPGRHPSDAELLALPDAVPRLEPRATSGNPAFYEVYGQRYTVLASAHGFTDRGVASWYGPDFHGIATSTGEPYDMYGMTAAHKTLPLPAYVRVTNLRNGRSVVVRVNDRGPFKSNRIIDLSYAAAVKLDMVRDGTALVEIRAEDPDGSHLADTIPSAVNLLYAQVGAFGKLDNAERLRDRLLAAGVAGVTVRTDETPAAAMYRVRVGPVNSVDAYDGLVAQLHRLGVNQVMLAPN